MIAYFAEPEKIGPQRHVQDELQAHDGDTARATAESAKIQRLDETEGGKNGMHGDGCIGCVWPTRQIPEQKNGAGEQQACGAETAAPACKRSLKAQ